MMYWFSNHYFMHGFGGIFMILFWLLLIILIFLLVKKSSSHSGRQETAEDILKKRYARGEISREVFERMKKDIRQ